MSRKDPPKVAGLQPGDRVVGYVHECPNCREWFIARLDAVYCSNACRVATSRKNK